MDASTHSSARGPAKDFYNEFTSTRMLKYRLNGNPRLDRAASLILRFLKPSDCVLDIGCGIGIVTEKVAAQLKDGRMWACDLAENNIDYARKTINSDKITFFAADVLEDFATVKKHINAPINLVTMVDVIEHLPTDKHQQFFSDISAITSDDAIWILTYPSPEYQRHLYANDVEELQVIDEIIEIGYLNDLAQSAGFKLKYFSYQEGLRHNQFVHAVFAKQLDYNPNPPAQNKLWRKVSRRLKYSARKLLLPYYKYKYVRPFEQKQ